MPKHSNDCTKGRAMQLFDNGLSSRKIARMLNVGRSSVMRWRKKYYRTGKIDRKVGSGRKQLVSNRLGRRISRLIECGDCENARDIELFLENNENICISQRTIQRILKKNGYHAVVKKKKPFLTAQHKKKRLEFARTVKNWTINDWKKVIFSDETKINLKGSDGKRYVWKKKNAPLNDRFMERKVRYGGGGIMIWSCFGYKSVGYACRVDGGIDAAMYQNILADEMIRSVEWCVDDEKDYIFWQDNASSHKAATTMKWFEENDVKLIEVPANSPDLNPIENLWWIIKCHIHQKGPFSNKETLFDVFADEWNKLETNLLEKLIESMPQRIEAVIKAKGDATKW